MSQYDLVRMEPEIAEALATVGADTEDCEEDDWREDGDPPEEDS